MTTLIVDNYDSFVWNLYQLVGALGGAPVVVRNDAIDHAGVRALAPRRIVLSPGPGSPHDPRRVGVSPALVLADDTPPILGVCLGHQTIVAALGGVVAATGAPVHGKTSLVHHRGDDPLLGGLPVPFEAMRYHSLAAVPEALPDCLAVTAWCKDGTIMGVRHTGRPMFGLQFHPESIGTRAGSAIVERFLFGDLA